MADGQHQPAAQEESHGSSTCPPPSRPNDKEKKPLQRSRRSIVARGKDAAKAAWQVSKVFSPPVRHPGLRVVALWLVATRILLTFIVTLVVRAFFGGGVDRVLCRACPPLEPPPSTCQTRTQTQASGIAQVVPALKAPLISLVVGLLVPADPFSRPCVDIIVEGARA